MGGCLCVDPGLKHLSGYIHHYTSLYIILPHHHIIITNISENSAPPHVRLDLSYPVSSLPSYITLNSDYNQKTCFFLPKEQSFFFLFSIHSSSIDAWYYIPIYISSYPCISESFTFFRSLYSSCFKKHTTLYPRIESLFFLS